MTGPESSSARVPAQSSPPDSVEVSGARNVVTGYLRGPDRTPAAVCDALDPAQRERFKAEYRAALARAAETLDLEPVLTLVQRTWWVRAVMNLNPEMLDGVAAEVDRVNAGDESILADQDT